MAEANKADYVVGVDLGGTKILAGVFESSSLKCIATAKLSTKSQRGVDKVIERVARCAQDAIVQVRGHGAPAATARMRSSARIMRRP